MPGDVLPSEVSQACTALSWWVGPSTLPSDGTDSYCLDLALGSQLGRVGLTFPVWLRFSAFLHLHVEKQRQHLCPKFLLQPQEGVFLGLQGILGVFSFSVLSSSPFLVLE